MTIESYIPVKPAVEAVQLTEDNLADVIAWINSVATEGGIAQEEAARVGEAVPLIFHAKGDHGGAFTAKYGQWITLNSWGGFRRYTETGFSRVHRTAGDTL